MRLFRATRTMQVRERVEVFAEHEAHARELIENDDECITIIEENMGDWEIPCGSENFFEVKE